MIIFFPYQNHTVQYIQEGEAVCLMYYKKDIPFPTNSVSYIKGRNCILFNLYLQWLLPETDAYYVESYCLRYNNTLRGLPIWENLQLLCFKPGGRCQSLLKVIHAFYSHSKTHAENGIQVQTQIPIYQPRIQLFYEKKRKRLYVFLLCHLMNSWII